MDSCVYHSNSTLDSSSKYFERNYSRYVLNEDKSRNGGNGGNDFDDDFSFDFV